MNYLEWNNLLGQYFFNPENAGKDVYLYITKSEIIELASRLLPLNSSEETWTDFIKAIKDGIPGSSQLSLIDKSIYALGKSHGKVLRIEGTEILRPAYIAYLTFFVLPLIEHQGEFTASNYYGRLKEYLRINGLDNRGIETLTFQKMDHLWQDLSVWANIIKNKDFGSFSIRPFTNSRWVYVGKPFSQCIFPPKAIKKLPEFFLAADMIPDSLYGSSEIRKNLLHHGPNILFLSKNAIESIKASDSNELGQSIIEKTLQEYKRWSGESHSLDNGITKRNVITARIYLQFQPFTNTGRIEFSYRMRYRDEFPEDLNFSGIEILEEKAGYSRTINLPFKETFSLKDEFTKWIAKFPDKDVRLFISAGLLQFSTDYWIETDSLTKVSWMYLLCKNTKREKILNWLKAQCSQFDDESDYTGMPANYSLFKFLDPKDGLSDIPELTIIKDKSIQLVSALKTDFRTLTDDFSPEVEIINADGTEEVYFQYKNNEEKIALSKKTSLTNRWLLPENITLNTDFNIRVARETYKENEVTYKIISSKDSALHIDDNQLPKRDSFGRIVVGSEIASYSIGSNTIGISLSKQIPYEHIFRSTKEDTISTLYQPNYEHSNGNLLMAFLSLKKVASVKDFFCAFDLIHSKYNEGEAFNPSVNYSVIKKSSLNFFDYLGYLDYEYETEKIVVNPPQLILLPANKGRKALLIGGRDASLVNAIIEKAPQYNLQVEITKQFDSNNRLLLPDAITIKAYGNATKGFGEANLSNFAQDIGIKFNLSELVQVSLLHFCSDLENYEQELFKNKEVSLTYEDWARYIFNPNNFKLEPSVVANFDKSFSLLEYRLRPWEFHYRLWKDNKCYDVDRNWGRFSALHYFKRNVVLYDRAKEKVAVPVGTPLPRLLSESIMLLSGLAPEYMVIDGTSYRVYENIPSVFIQNLFVKLKQRVNERNI